MPLWTPKHKGISTLKNTVVIVLVVLILIHLKYLFCADTLLCALPMFVHKIKHTPLTSALFLLSVYQGEKLRPRVVLLRVILGLNGRAGAYVKPRGWLQSDAILMWHLMKTRHVLSTKPIRVSDSLLLVETAQIKRQSFPTQHSLIELRDGL